MEKENLVNEPERDDSKDIVTIDYYDRINKRWIKLDVTKEVARLLHTENERTRRANNRYNHYNLSFDEVFDSNKDDNPKNEYLIDENASPDVIMEKKEQAKVDEMMRDEQRAILENSIPKLTETQQEIIKCVLYDNMSYGEIAKLRNTKKSSVYKAMKSASRKIKREISDKK